MKNSCWKIELASIFDLTQNDTSKKYWFFHDIGTAKKTILRWSGDVQVQYFMFPPQFRPNLLIFLCWMPKKYRIMIIWFRKKF